MRAALALLPFAADVSGARAAPAPALSDRVVQYAIDVSLDAKSKTLSGSERLTWRNPSALAVRELRLHLYMNAFRNRESTFMRESPGRRSGAVSGGTWGWIDLLSVQTGNGGEIRDRCTFISPDDDNAKDSTVLRVPLPAPVPAGGRVSLSMTFIVQLPRVIARTGYYGNFFMIAQWFPKVGVFEPAGMRFAGPVGGWNCHQFHGVTEFYADFGVYDVRMTVPGRFVVGATGRRIGARENEDSTVTYAYHAEDVHDFAWTASPDFVEVTDTWNNVSLRALVQRQHAGQAGRYLHSAAATLGYLAGCLGPYPYADLTIVDPAWGASEAGGMEYPQLITGETLSFMPEGVRMPELVTVHEITHQYFYGMVATNEFEEAWMDEGFTQYYETRIMDDLYGVKHSLVDFPDVHCGDLEFSRIMYTGMSDPGIAPITTLGWKFPAGSYSALTYSKTTLVLATLEGMIGRPAMDSVMRGYFNRWKFRHPCGRDFVAVVDSIAPRLSGNIYGRDMEWFFDQVLNGTGVCDYELKSIAVSPLAPSGDSAGGMFVSVVTAARLGSVCLPVEVAVWFEDGRRVTEQWDGKAKTVHFRYTGASKAVRAAVDPEGKIPLDVNVTNNARSAGPPEGLLWKYTAKVLFWVQNIFLLSNVLD